MVMELIGPVLADYIARTDAALELEDRKPGRVVRNGPGQRLPWDECCEGQLWGQVVNILPITGDRPIINGAPCGVLAWQVTLSINIIRCIAVVDDTGAPPTPEEIENDGQVVLDDLATIQQVILCNPLTRSIVSWQPLASQGGCAGGAWTFTVRIDACPCPSQPWPILEPIE